MLFLHAINATATEDGQHEELLQLKPDGFVDAPGLAWVEAARDVLHAHSAANELQHGLSLQEGGCRDVHVEGEA